MKPARLALFSTLFAPWGFLSPLAAVAEPAHDLDPMVVTGTRTMHRLSEAPIRTEVLAAHDFRQAGAVSLADAVEFLPGVRVENNCQNCGTTDLLMLGLEGKYTALLVDGLPLQSGLAAVYGLDQIPSAFIERIEVVKGGGSAMYGAGAVGGVVNIIGHTPRQTGLRLEFAPEWVKGVPTTQAAFRVDYAPEDDGLALSVYGQTRRAGAVDLNHDGFSDLTRRELDVLGLRGLYRAEAGTLRFDYSHTEEFRRGGNHLDLPDHLADISERVDTKRDVAVLAWQGDLAPGLDYHLAAGAAWIDRATFYGGLFGNAPDTPLVPESSPGAGDHDQAFLDRGYRTYGEVARDQYGWTDNALYTAEGQANVAWGMHHSSVGFSYRRETITDLVPVSNFVAEYPVASDHASGETLGAFVQDDWHFSDGWEAVMGMRADRASTLGTWIASPRLALRWAPTAAWVIRASAGTGFRAPEPFDEDLHIELIAGERAATRQAADLEEERSTSYLLGAVWNPPATEGRLTLEANLFRTELAGTFTHTEVRTDPATGEAYRLRINGPDSTVQGMELNVGALPWDGVRFDFAYVLQSACYAEAVVVFDDGVGNTIATRDFLETPRHTGSARLTLTTWPKTTVTLGAVYTGTMQQINQRTGVLNSRTEDFLVWNGQIERVFTWANGPQLTLTAGIKNAFDTRQRDLESGPHRDPNYFYGPRTPRTVYLSAAVEF